MSKPKVVGHQSFILQVDESRVGQSSTLQPRAPNALGVEGEVGPCEGAVGGWGRGGGGGENRRRGGIRIDG